MHGDIEMFNYFAWSFKQMRRCNADFAFVAWHIQALLTIEPYC